MGKKKDKKALSDPSRLKPFDEDDDSLIQVVIETPKGSRNKYVHDPEQEIFALKKVLPAGMVFPYDFGFVPSTKAEDGDPLDVLVLMDEPAFPGCLLKCRLIGVIEGQQNGKNSKVRNDRLLAVEQANHSYQNINSIQDLSKKLLKEIEEFFVNYHQLEGSDYQVLALEGPKVARKLMEKALR